MSYNVVYDSTRSNLWWWLTESPILILGLFFVWLILRALWRSPERPTQRLLLATVLVLACVGGLWRLGYRYSVSRHFYRYYGSYHTIKGVVKNYKTFSTQRRVGERFEVGGVRFGYIDSFQWKCFHNGSKWRPHP